VGAAFIALVLMGGPSPAQQSLGPIDPALRQALDEVRPDKKPQEIIRGNHYLVSNENQPYLVHEGIQDKGGMYIGVGAEQNYLFAGWAKPEVLVLLDFDQVIVDLHGVYEHFFRTAETPEAFIALWHKSNKREVAKSLMTSTENKRWGERLAKLHRESIWTVYPRLISQAEAAREHGVPNFLTDIEQYRYVADLFRHERVLRIRGDLTEARTLHDLTALGRRFKLPVRVVYLSNCEHYFKYRQKHYRANMLGMPFDEHSVIVHTYPLKGRYKYVLQSGPNFQGWLQCACVGGLRSMVRTATFLEQGDFSIIQSEASEHGCCSQTYQAKR
jgi:hypothetical protein